MKQIFNRLIILIVSLMTSTATVSAQAWVDKLINRYKNSDGVEKQISINRDPESRKVVREDYLFSFSAPKEYNYVKSELVKHSDDADYFHMIDEKSPRVTFRQSNNNQRTTIDIVKAGKSYRLTINRVDDAYVRAEETQRQAQAEVRQAQRQAQSEASQAQRQAQEQVRRARKEARQAQRQAQEQARQAQRQAQEQVRQAQLQAKQARIQAQRIQSATPSHTKVVRADSAANTAAIVAQRELLRKAKARRRK